MMTDFFAPEENYYLNLLLSFPAVALQAKRAKGVGEGNPG